MANDENLVMGTNNVRMSATRVDDNFSDLKYRTDFFKVPRNQDTELNVDTGALLDAIFPTRFWTSVGKSYAHASEKPSFDTHNNGSSRDFKYLGCIGQAPVHLKLNTYSSRAPLGNGPGSYGLELDFRAPTSAIPDLRRNAESGLNKLLGTYCAAEATHENV